jgi:flagellin
MGLRLINNINSIKAGRQLSTSGTSLSQSLERLSSGLQINRGADSPAGLIISEQLRGQIVGLKQAVDNSQKAINVVGTAEGALSEVNSLLLSIRKLAVDSSNLGTTDQDQLDANQAEVDSAINSIDRIADTTQYAGKKLLNGSSGFETSNVDSSIEKLSISRVQLGSQASADVNYNITAAATFDADSTIQVTGSQGSQQISFASGSTLQQIADAVDALNENPGVTARLDTAANSIVFSSTDVGSDASVKIEDIDGNGQLLGTIASASNTLATVSDKGTDIQGTVNGAVAQGVGRTLSINTPVFTGSISFDYATAAGTTTAVASNASQGVTGRDAARVAPGALPAAAAGSFTVDSEGLKFQLGAYTDPNNQESIGIDNLNTYNQGVQAGRLSSIKSGGGKDHYYN